MAIYRCNHCAFVAESAFAPGTKVDCEKCGKTTTLFATAFYVEKLAERYLATLRELETFKQGDDDPEPDTVAAPISFDRLKNELHNTLALATPAQHQPLLDWFAAKQIKTTFDFSLVDTTGFFDEAATEIGNHYDLLAGAIEQIRFAYRKEWTWTSIELKNKDARTSQLIRDSLRKLYGQTFFTRYHFNKQKMALGLGIQPAIAVRNFFEGGWLEWHVFMCLLSLCTEQGLTFSCARGPKVLFQNEEQRELDVVFLVTDRQPLVVECKSGEFRGEIDKYIKLRRRLGIDKTHFIVCGTDLTEEEATGLTAMYDLTFVALASLRVRLAALV